MDLTVVGYFGVTDGYGSMTEYVVLGAARTGATVNVIALGINPIGTTDEFRDILERSRPELTERLLINTWPSRATTAKFVEHDNLFFSTMYETNEIPPLWPAPLNRARAVIVAARHNLATFRTGGIDVPIEVVPDGVDPATYFHVDRPDRSLTALMVGMPDPRKNMDVGIAAWQQAFEGQPDARLIIKSKNGLFEAPSDDARIIFVDSNEPTRGILHWYQRADVLMALGNEGFGLPLIEGMATGLPVIALDSEGQRDVCREAGDLVLAVPPVRWEPLAGHYGLRGIPDVADVARQLRWVAKHRVEARDMGRAASRWVLAHRNVWRKGPDIAAVIDQYSV